MTLFSCRLDHRRTLRNRSAARSQLSISGVVNREGNRLRGIRLGSGTLRTTVASGFVDVSALTGINMYRSTQANQILKAQRDAGLVQTVGGLGVLDWNEDGFDDLLAWDVRRTLTLFVNDGRGGFLSRADLIDPEDVGLHMLSVDLNDDGRMELISSQLVGCEDGQAWFGFLKGAETDSSALAENCSYRLRVSRLDVTSISISRWMMWTAMVT